MPIYEYRCEACGHELEVMQRISAEPLETCPKCAASSLRKLISQTSFALKGSGWYATDYKQSGAKPEQKAKDKGDGASAGSSPAAKESKPEPKTASSGSGSE